MQLLQLLGPLHRAGQGVEGPLEVEPRGGGLEDLHLDRDVPGRGGLPSGRRGPSERRLHNRLLFVTHLGGVDQLVSDPSSVCGGVCQNLSAVEAVVRYQASGPAAKCFEQVGDRVLHTFFLLDSFGGHLVAVIPVVYSDFSADREEEFPGVAVRVLWHRPHDKLEPSVVEPLDRCFSLVGKPRTRIPCYHGYCLAGSVPSASGSKVRSHRRNHVGGPAEVAHILPELRCNGER